MRVAIHQGISVGGRPFRPVNIRGCVMWMRADAGVTLNGGTVSGWADQSGNGNNASQGTASLQPVYTASAVNGRPGITFDGADDVLQTAASSLGSATDFTCIVSAKLTSVGASPAAYIATVGGPYGNVTMAYSSGSGCFFGTDITNRVGGTAGVIVTGAAHVTSFAKSGSGSGNLTVWLDGTQKATNGASTALAPSGAHSIGFYTGGLAIAGSILEIAMYNRALSTSERQIVERYMGARYGVTVA